MWPTVVIIEYNSLRFIKSGFLEKFYKDLNKRYKLNVTSQPSINNFQQVNNDGLKLILWNTYIYDSFSLDLFLKVFC